MSKISVIVPTYNRGIFISECIDAILAQKHDVDFDLIVVDDGSTDETPRILEKYQKKYIPSFNDSAGVSPLAMARAILEKYQKKITIIRQKNAGVSAARNAGIAAASGEYLAFCDSDDIWLPDKLKQQMKFFGEHPDYLVCYTDELWIRNGVRVNQCKHHTKISGWIFESSLELCLVSPSSVMMHRRFFDLVGLFDTSLPACEDYDLWLRASLVMPFYCLETPLIIKRGGHQDQLSKKYWGMDRFRIQAIEKCLTNMSLTEQQRKKAIQVLQKKSSILANGARKRGNYSLAQEYDLMQKKWDRE